MNLKVKIAVRACLLAVLATFSSLALAQGSEINSESSLPLGIVNNAIDSGKVNFDLDLDGRNTASRPASILTPSGQSAFSCGVSAMVAFAPVVADLQSLSLSQSSVTGGAYPTATVTLTEAAPAGGVTIDLSSSNTSAAVCNAQVTVPEGATTANFLVGTFEMSSDTAVTISATYGATVRTANLTVLSPAIVGINVVPGILIGGTGTSVTGTVYLSGRTGAGGKTVTLTSSNAAAITVPASITIPANSSTGTFTVTPSEVANTSNVTITAAMPNGSMNQIVVVNPYVKSVDLAVSSIAGGGTTSGTVTLNGPAPVGGLSIVMSSSNPFVAFTSNSLVIPAGQTSGTFSIGTVAVASNNSITFSANYGLGTKTSSAITVLAPTITSLTLNQTELVGGSATTVTGTLNISSVALSTGLNISLSSNTGSVTVPSTVTVPNGATSTTFSVTHTLPANDVNAVITATLNGTNTTVNLRVIASKITAISVEQSPVQGGSYLLGTITLSQAAPAGGSPVVITNNQSATVFHNGTVTVPAGQTSTTFLIGTAAVGSTVTATITGNTAGATATTTLVVSPPVPESTFLSHDYVTGGSGTVVTGHVKLNSAAPAGGRVVTLTSSDTSAATVPASVTVPAGSIIASYTVTHLTVATSKTTTITATAGGTSVTTTLTVNP